MPAGVILAGLGCGALLAAGGLALGGGFRQVPGLSHAVRVVRWFAGGFLAIGGMLAWRGSPSPVSHALPSILMAALAALPTTADRRLRPWRNAVGIVPALALAGAGFFRLALGDAAPDGAEPGGALGTLMALAVLVCGGLGARALGQALSQVVAPEPRADAWSSVAGYALLTLLVAGTAAVNLWQRGSAWGEMGLEEGLAGAWLAWNAARAGPRAYPRLQAGLNGLAALFLVAVAAGV